MNKEQRTEMSQEDVGGKGGDYVRSGEEQMAAASERKTPLINEYLVIHFLNSSLPTGA